MPERKVNIENLSIRLPEQFRDEAQNLGQDLARNLSMKLPRHFNSNHFDSLNYRVIISKETTRSQLTTLITEAILKGWV